MNTRKPPPRPKQASSFSPAVIAILVVAVVAVIGIIVAVAMGSGDSGNSARASGEQTQDVSVGGSALIQFPGTGVADPAIGQPAPTFSGESFDGESVSFRPGASGKPTVFVFGAHWCPVCQRELPEVAAWMTTPAAEQVEVIGVSTGVNPAAENYPPSAWFEAMGWPGAVIADDEQGTLGKVFGLKAYPYTVVTDAQGNVTARRDGAFNPGEWESFLTDAGALQPS